MNELKSGGDGVWVALAVNSLSKFVLLWLLCCGSVAAQAWRGDVHPDLPGLRKQAEAGDTGAMAAYAFHSMRCMGGLEYEPDLIFDYFTRSAAAGDVEGTVGLAHCYCFNVGTVRNLKKAHELIQGPLKENHPVALKVMGFLHYGKQGVMPVDHQKVIEYNRKAAEMGCVAARYNLAINAINGVPEPNVEKGMNELRRMHEERVFAMAPGFLLSALRDHRIWPDHDQIFNSCVKRITEYAEVNEPYALYRLGIFHHDAGGMENAVACYARSAHLGNGDAWFSLWRISNYGAQDDFGNIWARSQDRGNLAMRAYERGVFNGSSLADAGWEITRRFWLPGYQERLPMLEEDAIRWLKKGKCDLHNTLGRLYYRAQKGKNPRLVRPEWAKAHLVAHSHHGWNASAELARRFFEAKKTTENLARGYACAVCARGYGGSSYNAKKRWKWVQDQMTPEARKRAEELIEDAYPRGEKHRRKAEDFLIKIGHLLPREKE